MQSVNIERNRITETLIPHNKIEQRISEVAKEIRKDYEGKNLLLVGILTGCFKIASSLSEKLWEQGFYNAEVDFMGLESYNENNQSGELKITKDLKRADISNYHVLIVEDIKDKGHTLKKALEIIKSKNPLSAEILVLVSKKEAAEVEVPVKYVCFEIDNVWVEGFGLDSGEYGRGNPDIIKVTPHS